MTQRAARLSPMLDLDSITIIAERVHSAAKAQLNALVIRLRRKIYRRTRRDTTTQPRRGRNRAKGAKGLTESWPDRIMGGFYRQTSDTSRLSVVSRISNPQAH